MQGGDFIRLRDPTERVSKGAGKAPGQVGGFLTHHAFGQGAGAFHECRIIHEHERLQRRLRALAQERADFAVGSIKGGEGRIVRRTAPENVHAASIERVAVVLFVLGVGAVPDSRRLVGPDAWTADFRVQQAGHGQGIVADELGVELQPRAAGQPAIVRVLLQLPGRNGGGLAVRRAGHDQPDQRLHVPWPDGMGA